MKIGELAARTHTPVQSIRYYEREGLMPAAARSAGNYRLYLAEHVERLGFIRRARALDMTLDEIRVLLHFKDSPQEGCAEVNALLDEHIGHVAERMRELRQLERQLKALREQCAAPRAAADCGILGGLSALGDGTPAQPGAAGQPHKGALTGHVHGAHGRGRAAHRP
ncbi:MAG TPA: Cd(II)/Pb(II)-responsive transcriptional regulator [Rubrivivax sp.]|nr:Cd(II)/Pb(II)-responsive transcriptional regulator [Rubrivivax sp.]